MGPHRPIALAAALALAAASAAGAAGAEDRAKPVAVAAKLAQDARSGALTFDLSRAVEARAYTLASPDRIVVDLPEVVFQIASEAARANAAAADGSGLVRAFRFGQLAPGKSRIVMDLSGPACPVGVGSRPIAAGLSASRLTIEIRACDDAEFKAAAMPVEASPPPPDGAPAPTRPIIVLDPGHGGNDGGAHGVNGSVEKTLVFAFCGELKRQLQESGRYAVLMTREGDQYVDLDSRVDFARNSNASLLVSIHADTLSEAADVSGSTVYTVADRASDAEAARIAARENAADRDPRKAEGGRERSRRSRHPFRSEAAGDARVFPSVLAQAGRRIAGRDPAESQSGAFRGLRRAEGAGVPLGAGRTRLSFQPPGRRSARIPGLAKPDRGRYGQSDRRFFRRLRRGRGAPGGPGRGARRGPGRRRRR